MSILQKARERSFGATKAYEAQVKASISKLDVAPARSSNSLLYSADRSQRDAYSLFRNWIFVAVNTVAKKMASQPVCAGESVNATPNPDRRIMPGSKRYQWEKLPPRLQNKAPQVDLELIQEHPVLDMFSQPNPVQRKFEFFYISAANLLITGESYWIGGTVERDGEQAVETWAVPTHWITPIHQGGLFTGYKYQPTGQAEPVILDPEVVARTYFPDPRDIKSSYSPLRAIMPAARIDDHIQASQELMFERGINPNLIITVGKSRGADGRNTDRRPVLTGAHRRQLIRSIREVWGNTVSQGDPAIVDGLIESVHKLQMTPQEMDWITSGEQVKSRIFQAFAVNPIVVGEIVGANRAQAVEAEKHFCNFGVNPIVDAFSETMTTFHGPMYEKPERLVLWVKPCEPEDPELELRRWEIARANDDATRNEYRTEVLGLPPSEEAVQRNQLLTTVGGMQGASALLTAVGNGLIGREQAANVLSLFLQIDEEQAMALVGEEEFESPMNEDEVIDGSPDDALDEAPPEEQDVIAEAGVRPVESLQKSVITRKSIEETQRNQIEEMEGLVANALARPFLSSVRQTARNIRKLKEQPEPENANAQAQKILAKTHDEEAERVSLEDAATNTLPVVFSIGATMELELNKAVLCRAKTTAQEIAERLELVIEDDENLPAGISLGPLPDWMIAEASHQLEATFKEDYWLKIPLTTRDNLQTIVRNGIEEGWSMRRVARSIMDASDDYSMSRAMMVARTETGNALNAGHSAGIERLEGETGIKIGKEWLSVLGNTTRPSHAELDGQRADTSDGTFNLAGVNVPWPAHNSLPPEERINCQCTIISALVADNLG